jgi:hypothetical protein
LILLRAEVDRTREDYTRAKEQFWKIAADIPSGLPYPDGTQRVQIAARAQTAAMVGYTKALRQFNAFLLDGTVPEELLRDKDARRKPVAGEKIDSEDKSKRLDRNQSAWIRSRAFSRTVSISCVEESRT